LHEGDEVRWGWDGIRDVVMQPLLEDCGQEFGQLAGDDGQMDSVVGMGQVVNCPVQDFRVESKNDLGSQRLSEAAVGGVENWCGMRSNDVPADKLRG
jgi:hypothetical protein